jgi:replication factor C subunit 2/4
MNFNDLLDIKPRPQNKKPIIDNLTKTRNKTPWIEKYRPKNLDEVIFQHDIIKILKQTVLTGNLPHLLLYGPPGTGKTSTILAIAMELFGPTYFKERILELNASDERGINIVRNKIINFAKSAISSHDKNYPSPPYKIIILDEADAMTMEAQSALRKTIEDNSHITRFCFICNYINQIIEPINSRCVKYRFKPIKSDLIFNKLKVISAAESLVITDDALELISNNAEGDMRSAIMLLQNLKYITAPTITKEIIFEVSGYLTDELVMSIESCCISGQNSNLNELTTLVNNITSLSYPIQNILYQISNLIIYNKLLNDGQKANISLHIAKTEKRIIDGANEYIQLMSLLMYIKSINLNLDSNYKLYIC